MEHFLKGELIKDNDNNWIFLIDDVFCLLW